MGDLSRHFSTDEFLCHCGCGEGRPKLALLALLEDVRAHFGRAVIVTSGYRCAAHNAAVGGAPKSRHLTGEAADIVVAGSTPKEVAEYLESRYQDSHGIGIASRFVHIDVRNKRARWAY